jgi:class 3 adenylate cyclase
VLTGRAPLVGRRAELAWLEEHLDDALRGRPHVVLLSGDAGIGKSRLVRELQRRAVDRGAEVFAGRCREHLEVPYLPFVASLFPRLEEVAHEHADLGDDGRIIGRLLGRTAATEPAGAAADASPEQQQAWLFVAMARLLFRLAQRRPLMLVVDDLHWADRPSLDLLGHIGIELADRAVRGAAPVLVIVNHRPEPPPPVAAEVFRLRREEIASTLELGGLAEVEVADLVRTLGVERASRQLVTTLHRATGGNPLFVESLASGMAGGGGVEERGGELVAGPRAPSIPEELRQAIDGRVDEAGDTVRELLTVAAFLGDTVRLRDLEAVTGTGQGALHELVDEAVARGVLAWDGLDLRFAHPLFSEALYARPAPSRRRQLHLAVADALEEPDVADDPPDARAIEIAHHLIEAGPLADPARLLDRARAAGERAWTMLAWGEAARCFAAAAAAAEQTGGTSDTVAELHFRAGVAHARNLDQGPTRHHLERAATAYRFLDDRRGVARTLAELVRVEITTGSFGAARDLGPLDTALGALGDDPGLAAVLLAQMAEALWVAGLPDQAAARAEQALTLARAASDDAACARVLVALAMTRWMRLELPAALANLEEALERARRHGDPWLEGIPLPRLALTHLWLGRLDDATKAAAAAIELTDVTGDWAERSLAMAALVGVAVARGNFDAAEAQGEQAWLAARLARYEWSCLLFFPALVTARLLRGDAEGAAEAVGRLRELEAGSGAYAFVADVIDQYVSAYRTRGRADELDAGLLAADWPLSLGTTAWFAVLAELADLTTGDVPLERIDAALGTAAERGLTVTDGLVFLVPRVRGVVARLRGDDDTAEAQLRAAVAVAEREHLRPELAHSCLELARVLRVREGGAAQQEATALAERARDLFSELDMPGFTDHARRVACAAAGTDAGDIDASWPEGMAVILFTDVVGSTALTEEMGDRAYRARAEALDDAVREAIDECAGEAIEGIRLGDGVVAMFDSARSALECAERVHGCARFHALALHVGIHAGDVLRTRTGVHGGAVNIAARVCDRAEPGETLVSDTIRGIARTSADVRFEDRGVHDLKGVGDPMRLFAVATPEASPEP